MTKNRWFESLFPAALCLMFQLALYSLSVFKGTSEGYTGVFLAQLLVSAVMFGTAAVLQCDFSIPFCSSVLVSVGGFTQTAISNAHPGFEDGRQTFLIHMLIGVAAFLMTVLFLNCDRRQALRLFYEKRGLNLLALISIGGYLAAIAGGRIAGAANWIVIEGFSFQITEISKLMYFWILGIASAAMTQRRIRYILLLYLLHVIFLVWASEFGFIILITLVTAIMLFISVLDWRDLRNCLAKSLLLVPVAAAGTAVAGWLRPNLVQNIIEKIIMRTELFFHPEQDPYGLGYQLIQGEKAILRGGAFGTSLETYVPVLDSDMVFPIMIELFGVAMGIMVLLLFGMLCMNAVARSADNGSSLGITMAVSLLVQVLYHTAAAVGLMPLSGMTLPFISMGGTSYVLSMVLLAVLFSTCGQSYLYFDKEVCSGEEEEDEIHTADFSVHFDCNGRGTGAESRYFAAADSAAGRKKKRCHRRSKKSEDNFWNSI